MKEKINKLINVIKKDGFIKSSKKMIGYFSSNYLSKINFVSSLKINGTQYFFK